MLKKEIIFFSAIILLGFLDWLTTVTGIFFYGAAEFNPLLSGLTKSSMMLFSVVKLSAVVLIGFAFYKAAAISKSRTNDWRFTKRFLYGGYSLTFLVLTAVVASNMIAIFRI
jgi:polyferredoxin